MEKPVIMDRVNHCTFSQNTPGSIGYVCTAVPSSGLNVADNQEQFMSLASIAMISFLKFFFLSLNGDTLF